jgi:hypothetical protein
MAERGIIDANNNFKTENWWARQDLNLGLTDYEVVDLHRNIAIKCISA